MLSFSRLLSPNFATMRLQQPLVSLRQFSARSLVAPRLRRFHQRVYASKGPEELNFAVFRFTLGIPGFDDDLIPRAIGVIGTVLLIINHVVAGTAESAAQGRAEFIGAIIAAACIATPSVQAVLKEMQLGGGGKSGAAGAGGAFLLAADLSEQQRKELAWASYALLRNTNVCGLLVWRNGVVLAARGSLGSSSKKGTSQQALAALAQEVDAAVASCPELHGASDAGGQAVYLADRAALQRAGSNSWDFAPSSAQSMLAISLTPNSSTAGPSGRSAMLLFSDQPRGLSQRQRSWVAAIAAKLGSTCL